MRRVLAGLAACVLAAPVAARPPTPPLRVVATTTTIASVVMAVGGDDVTVTLLQHEPGPAGEARETAALALAQLLVRNGDGGETAWLAPRLAATSNTAVRPGGRAAIDVSQLGTPADCSPSELLDPMRGLALAGALRDMLERLRPPRREAFTEAYETFRSRLAVAMLGERIGTKYPLDKVADLHRLGTLDTFLAAQHESTLLGGWFGLLRTSHGVKAAADRASWGCFARRFGIDIVALWDAPDHGRPSGWKARGLSLLLAGAGDGPTAARTAARRARMPVAALAGQVGTAPEADNYLDLLDFDVRAVAQALGGVASHPPKPAR